MFPKRQIDACLSGAMTREARTLGGGYRVMIGIAPLLILCPILLNNMACWRYVLPVTIVSLNGPLRHCWLLSRIPDPMQVLDPRSRKSQYESTKEIPRYDFWFIFGPQKTAGALPALDHVCAIRFFFTLYFFWKSTGQKSRVMIRVMIFGRWKSWNHNAVYQNRIK